jgi:hypothetical protein
MSLVHHLADGLIIASFKSIADVQNPLHLTDYILRADKVFLGDAVAHLVEPYPLGVGKEFHLGVVLPDGGGGSLARLAALVIGAVGEQVLDAGIQQYEFVALGVEGEILILQSLAVQADKLAFLAEELKEYYR